MKNLARLFVAVAVLFTSFACTTDVTEDLGVAVGGQTTITVSLEESRTQLGEKADGVYPLYWSANDQISVNGIVSNALSTNEAGAANATFTFAGALEHPYCVVYPATSANEVTFPASQEYVEGTFAAGAAPMYGYAASANEAIQMHHLAGALRFDVSGSVTLSSLTVEAESGNLAGTYEVDCATGALTLKDAASNSVILSFGEGLALDTTATPIYVAVPAGEYDTVTATLRTTSGEKMLVKFNTSVKPISAGKVREFAAFEFAANVVEGDVIEIDSKEALIAFAANPAKSAVVVANIDMTGEAWTPIEGFNALTFDGGNFEIKGLSAPLFGTTEATIKNVKLVDVAIEETERTISGSIVCKLLGRMTNCSASGTYIANNTTATLSGVANKYADIAYGGLVGMASGAIITNCTNDVNLTIKSLSNSSVKSAVGGAIGGSENGVTLNHIVNNGDITLDANPKGNIYISGIVGKSSDVSGQTPFLSFNNCTNNGDITSASTAVCGGSLLVSGITGTIVVDAATGLVNNGDIKLGGSLKAAYGCGMASYNSSGDYTNCSNSGNISLDADTNLTEVYLAGLFWKLTASSMNNCHNTGNLTIGDNVTSAGYIRAVGLADQITGATGEYENCTNSGAISVGGVTCTATGNSGRVYAAGLFGFVYSGNLKNCHNLAAGTVTAKPKKLLSESVVAGFATYVTSTSIENQVVNIEDCSNAARIECSPEVTNGVYFGGITGQIFASKKDYTLNLVRVTNSGEIVAGGGSYGYTETTTTGDDGKTTTTVTGGKVNGIAGLIGHTLVGTTNFTNCSNTGAITVNPTGKNFDLSVGGIVGYNQHRLDNYIFTFSNCSASGKITYCPTSVYNNSRVGGFIGCAYGHTSYCKGQDIYENCTSSADVEVSGDGTLGRTFVGSFVGDMNQSSKFTSCSATSDAEVKVTAKKFSNNLNVGWVGSCSSLESTALYDFVSCTNSAVVNLNSEGFAAVNVSGLVGGNYVYADAPKASQVNVTDCKVEGSVTIAGKTSANVMFGGLCYYPYASQNPYVVTRFVNDCDLNVTAAIKGNLQVGGIGSYISATIQVVDYCNVSGDFNFSGSTTSYLSYGGFWNQINLVDSNDFSNFTHSGNVTLTGTVGTNVVVGGMGTQQKTPFYLANVANTGKITIGTKEKALTSSEGTYIRIAGLWANCAPIEGYTYRIEGSVINTGDIEINNLVAPKANEISVGGIVANLSADGVINGAKSYCNILCSLPQATYGMISGVSRANATVANCQVGGSVLGEYNQEDESYKRYSITADNYYNFIYGSGEATDWGTSTDYDGCTALTAKPSVN